MFCPSCGKENANTFGYCNACGKALTPVGGIAPGIAPGAAPAPAPAMPPRPMASAMPPTNGPAKRSGVIVAAVVFALVAAAGTFGFLQVRNTEKPEARIKRLVLEASGRQPIKKAFWAKDREFDDAFREQYKGLFRVNQEYMAAVKNTDISAAQKLGSPESFADPSAFTEGLRQVHAVYDLDMGQEQKVHEIVDNLRHIIETSSWSASDREGAVKGFDTGIAEPLAMRQTAVSAEQAWIQSIDDVYTYAEQNHSTFILNNGQLLIADNAVLEEFNSRVRTMNSRRTEFLQAKQNYDQYQQDLFRKMGVNPKDVGLQ